MCSRNFKKKLLFFCFIMSFLCFSSCTSQSSKVSTEEGRKNSAQEGNRMLYQSEELEISMQYGFHGIIQKNRKLPIRLVFETREDWKGRLKILIPSSQKKETSYEQELIIKEGRQEVDASIPDIGIVSYFKVYLENSTGEEIVTAQIETGIGTENISYMGVLSDTSDKISYFDQVKKQREDRVATVHQILVEKEELSEQIEQISVLDYLVINDASISTFSKHQKQAILDWVKRGGVLVTGMGGQHIKCLSELFEDIASLEKEQKEKVLVKFYLGEEEDNIILDHIPIRIEKDYQYESLLDRELIKAVSYGKGSICIAEFDLGETLLEQHQTDLANLIINQITTDNFLSLTESREETMQSLEKSLNMYYGDTIPNVLLYILLFFVYIGLIGPAAYFILRHFDKKTWFFIVVPIFSILFTALVFLGREDDGNKELIVTSFRVIDEQEEDEVVYLSSENTQEREYKLNLLESIQSLERMEDSDSLYQTNYFYDKIDKETECIVEQSGEHFSVHFLERPAFSQNVLKLYKEKEEEGEIAYQLAITDNSIEGTVENNTKYDFDYLLFYYQKRYYFITDFMKKQSFEMEKEDIEIVDLTTSVREYFLKNTKNTAIEKEQVRETNNIQKILAFLYQDKLKETAKDEGYFIGITTDTEDKIVQENDFTVKQKVVYIQSFERKKKDKNAGMDISQLYLKSIEGEVYNDILYSGSATLEYQFNTQMALKGLVRFEDNYEGTIYAYNYQNKKYDVVLKDKEDRITEKELSNYIDAQGNLKIQLKPKEDYTQIPIIVIAGSGTDAKGK